MSEIIRQGPLHLLLISNKKREWFKKYCFLCAPSSKSRARFLWYDNYEILMKDPYAYKVVFVEEIKKIVVPIDPVESRHLVVDFELKQGRRLTLGMSTRLAFNDWLHEIRDAILHQKQQAAISPRRIAIPVRVKRPIQLVVGDIYGVELIETEASRRNQLPQTGLMVIGAYCIQLRSADHEPICNWKFNHIRRYGRKQNSFTVEAGRRCRTGEGVFSFKTAIDGDIIFESVQRNIVRLGGQYDDSEEDEDDDGDYIGPNDEDYINAQFHLPTGISGVPAPGEDTTTSMPTQAYIDENGYMFMKRNNE